ncbi:helix-turn-helix transcriptional regulator [Parapedobacter koreensis]|uniref:Transcriptional regulator, AraC family n=1 Tax=Parapedobacter koreensis TaxID=332977 RepID=A0A1H7QY70_9SPHI|nr:helix-turn-helix domain-containing protein [Parapedobacter koreensis]SEL52634.1 transcriptional regulator, AraC family [Parapedobacter koreensis]
MESACHLLPINLSDATKLDSLVEHRRAFNLKDCQLNIFETYHRSKDVVLSYDGLVVSSMIRGRKIMSLPGSERFDFIPGQSIILPRGVSMRVDFPDADMAHPVQCATLALDWDMVDKNLAFLNEHYQNTAPPFEWRLNFSQYHFQNDRELANSINQLIRISMEEHAAKDALANIALKSLLLRIIQTQNLAIAQETRSTREFYFATVLAYIRKNLSERITVDMLAQVSGMSKTLFFRSFKSFLGTTPIEFIIRERVKLAKRLLIDPHVTVAEVCYRTGFNNVNYFIRQFKRLEGITPSLYQYK